MTSLIVKGMKFIRTFLVLVALCPYGALASDSTADYQYFRKGNAQDVTTHADFGVAMMGGGTDLDEAFRWLCAKGNGGDFLILRAHEIGRASCRERV